MHTVIVGYIMVAAIVFQMMHTGYVFMWREIKEMAKINKLWTLHKKLLRIPCSIHTTSHLNFSHRGKLTYLYFKYYR